MTPRQLALCALAMTLAPLPASGQSAPDLNALLRYEGDRHGTLGSVGARVFAERLEPAPGMRGIFRFLHETPDIPDPIVLRFLIEETPGKSVEPPISDFRTAWLPDRVETSFRAGPLLIRERKLITTDDCLFDAVSIENTADRPVTVSMGSSSRAGVAPDLSKSRFVPVDLGPFQNAEAAPGRDILDPSRAPEAQFFEAESPASQSGSRGADRKRAASGGRVLGANFGAAETHVATWRVATPARTRAAVKVRTARALPGKAPWLLVVDGRELGTIDAAPTGGWGDKPGDFITAGIEIGALAAGFHTVELRAMQPGSNTNFDGFWIAEADAALPDGSELRDGVMPAPPPLRQIHLEPGTLRVAGVEFRIDAPRLVLAGAPDAAAAESRPRSLRIAAPKGAGRLHVLGLVGGGFTEGRDAGRFVVRWSDGTEEEHRLVPGVSVADVGTRGTIPGARGADGLFVLTFERRGADPLARPRVLDATLEVLDPDALLAVIAASGEIVGDPSPVFMLHGQLTAHGVRSWLALGQRDATMRVWNRSDPELETVHTLAPGARVDIPVSLGFGADAEEASGKLSLFLRLPDIPEMQEMLRAQWFEDHVPFFASSDPRLDTLWWYRWFIVRHNLAEPATGRLTGPCFYEGRHGSWYPKVISYSSPHIIAEARWLRDPRFAFGQIAAQIRNAGPDGVFNCVKVDRTEAFYTDWIVAEAAEALAVHPDPKAIESFREGLIRNVAGTLRTFDRNGNHLPVPPSHWATGMEWQPSFFALSGFDNTKPETPLERADFAAYLHGNAMALSDLLDAAGDRAGAEAQRDLAARVRRSLEAVLWRADDRFYHAARESDGTPALAREIVGFYPFAFGAAPLDDDHLAAFDALFDPRDFWTPFPPASCSARVPVFSARIQRWPGPGGTVTGCMWNGPTWPHATSLVIRAAGRTLQALETAGRRSPHITRERFARLFDAWVRCHFEGGDPRKPVLREYLSGDTGEAWGCMDYFHSTFADLVIRWIAGLVPGHSDATVTFHPLCGDLEHFRLDRIRYRGRDIAIRWDRPDGKRVHADAPEGFSVLVDGKLVRTAPEPVRMEVPLR